MSDTSTSTNSGKSHAKIGREVRNAYRAATDEFDDVTNEVKDQVQNFTDELVKNVKKSPVKSVLIAGAIGLLFGKLFL
jgi:ElaB/YqjD/DUF883 family membrane-anchored ribosome-binding protein